MNEPVRGLSSVFTITPSLTHCQNCFCVVQNSLRSRQTIKAVLRFFFFFSLVAIVIKRKHTSPSGVLLRENGPKTRDDPKGKPHKRGSFKFSKGLQTFES